MKTRRILALSVLAAWGALLALPGGTRAEMRPIIPIEPIVFDSDPWVPDGKEPPGAYAPRVSRPLDDERSAGAPALRAEDWYRRILRLLRALRLGGLR